MELEITIDWVENLVGRELANDESGIVTWLNSMDDYTIRAIKKMLEASYQNGCDNGLQNSKRMKGDLNVEEAPLLTLDETINHLRAMVNPETEDEISISFEDFVAIESSLDFLARYKDLAIEKPL